MTVEALFVGDGVILIERYCMQQESKVTRGKVKKVFSDIFGSRSSPSRL
jgi:hypothetical protein